MTAAKTKTVYLFDQVTGEYRGGYEAHESPLEPNVFHAPVNSTELAPPKVGKNQVSVYRNGEWAIEPDFRKTELYEIATGLPVLVTEIGPMPNGVTDTVPSIVTRFQIKAAFHKAGLLEQAVAFIDDHSTDTLLKLAWSDAKDFRISSPVVVAIANKLLLPKDRLDSLFKNASELEP